MLCVINCHGVQKKLHLQILTVDVHIWDQCLLQTDPNLFMGLYL